MTRALRLWPLLLWWMFAACGCPGPSKTPTIRFTRPTDGQTLRVEDDEDLASADLQYTVQAIGENFAEASEVRLTVGDSSSPIAGTLGPDGQVKFDAVTLPGPGTVPLALTAVEKGSGRTDSTAITVVVEAGGGCRFATPQSGETLGIASDLDAIEPGLQVDVKLTCTGVPLGSEVTLTLRDPATKEARAPRVAKYTATGVTFKAFSLWEGENDLLARAGAATGVAVVTVSTGLCTARLSPPDGTIFNARGETIPNDPRPAVADADGSRPGIQARFKLRTDCADGGTATLSVDGQTKATGAVAAGEASFLVDLPDGEAVRISALVQDPVGKKGATLVDTHGVDAAIPTLAIIAPAPGPVTTDKNPLKADAQVEVAVVSQGLAPGTPFEIRADGNPAPVELAGSIDASGAGRAQVTLVNGTQTLTVFARRPSGTTAISTGVRVTVSVQNATVRLAAPANGATVTLASDADTQAAGFQLRFDVETTGFPAGTDATVVCSGLCGVGIVPVPLTAGKGSATVTLGTTPCGGLQAACVAEVASSAGVRITSVPNTTFTLDIAPPVVAFAKPFDGQTLGTASTDVELLANCSEAGQAVSLSVNGGTPRTATVAGETAVFSGVALVRGGGNQLEVTATDKAGNSVRFKASVAVDDDPPQVTLVDPQNGATMTVDADLVRPGMQVPFKLDAPNEAASATVKLKLRGPGAPASGTLYTTLGALAAAPPTLDVSEGSNLLDACVVDAALNERCASATFTVSGGTNPCAITSPAYAALVKGTSHTVEVSTDAASATLEVNGTALAPVTPTAGVATFTVSTPGTGSYRLRARCGTGGSATVPLQVLLSGPGIAISSPKDGDVLLAGAPDRGTAPGFQTDVTLETAANPALAPIGLDLAVRCDGVTANYLAVLGATAGRAATLRNVAMPDGICYLNPAATDALGNVSTTLARVVVDREAPVVRIAAPPDFDNLGQAADKDPVAPGLQIDVVATLSNIEAGATATLTLLSASGTTTAAPVTLAAGHTSVTFPLVTLPEGRVVLRVAVADPAGNAGCSQNLLSVDTQGPSLAIVFPAPGRMNVFNDVDRDLANGLQSQVQVQIRGSANGTLWLCSSVSGLITAECQKGPTGPAPRRLFVGPNTTDTPFENQTELRLTAVTIPEGLQQKLTAEASDVLGNLSAPSPPVSLDVDITPPSVVLKAAGDANGDKYLNATELPSGQLARFDLAVTGADGQTAELWIDGVQGPKGAVSGGAATILADLGGDGAKRIEARVLDAHFNPNTNPANPKIDNPASILNLTVMRTVPTILFTAPQNRPLNRLDDLDGSSSTTLETDVAVSTSLSSPGATVEFVIDGTAKPPTPVVSGAARLVKESFAEGNHNVVAEAVDVAGNRATAQIAIAVDMTAPTLLFVRPVAGPTTATTVVEVATNAESGQLIGLTTTVNATTIQLPSMAVPSAGNATQTVTLPNGTNTLEARVSDRARNPATPATVQVTVSGTGCSLLVTEPAATNVVYNAASDLDPGTAGIQVDIKGTTTDCRGNPVQLLRSGTVVATAPSNTVTGDFIFSRYTFNDGDTNVPMTVRMFDTATPPVATTVNFTVTADDQPPAFGAATPPFGAITVIAGVNNPPSLYGPTVIADKLPNAPGDVDLTYTVTGGVGGTLTAQMGAADLFPAQSITSDPQTVGPFTVQLPHDATNTVTVRLEDAAKNATVRTYAATVDVVPPGAPTAATGSVSDKRRANIALGWILSGDDGTTGSTTGHDIRHATSTDLPGGIPDDATFYGAGTTAATTPPGGGAPGSTVNFALANLAPLNRYAVGIRVTDEVGNRSPLTVVSVDNFWTAVTRSEPAATVPAGTFYGFHVKTGDLDGDGTDDLVATNALLSGNTGSVWAYYGSKTLAKPFNTAQQLSGSTSGEQYGFHAEVGDVDGDGIADLLVGARGFGSSRGRVFLYFGQSAAMLDPGGASNGVEFRGSTATAGQFGYAVKVVGNVDGDTHPTTGKPLNDLVISAPAEAGPAGAQQGRVYLFRGRTRTDWLALRQSDAGPPAVNAILVASADKVFLGNAAGNLFGARFGQIGAAPGEFFVCASNEVVRTAYFFRWAALGASPVGANSATTLITSPDPGPIIAGAFAGFGHAAVSADFTGDGVIDTVIAQPNIERVELYEHDTGGGYKTAYTQRVIPRSPTGRFGYSVAAGDLNLDGKMDLVAGSFSSVAGSDYAVHVFLNGGLATAPFNLGTVFKGAPTFGSGVAVGDFDGDGQPDLAAGAHQDGNGKVYVWY